MARRTLKILPQMPQDFESVSEAHVKYVKSLFTNIQKR